MKQYTFAFSLKWDFTVIGPSGVRIGPYFAIPFVDAAVKVF